MKALVGAFNQEKALVGAFSVIVKTGCGTDVGISAGGGENVLSVSNVGMMEILIREWKENKYHNIQVDICIIYYSKLKLCKINKNIWAPFCHFYFLKWYVFWDIIFNFLK